MQSITINPFFQPAAPVPAAPQPVRATTRQRLDPARYALLPQAPVNASPVPHLTSLYHNPDPGRYGKRSYPGNCSGNLIKDLLRFYSAGNCFDPMSGSGVCQDVCRELGIYCYSGDIHQGFDACEPRFTEAFQFCWAHPPYFRQKIYADDPRDLSRCPNLTAFLERYEQFIRACVQALVPGGKLVILMGDYQDRHEGFLPLVFHTKVLAFRCGLRQIATDIIRFSHGASSSRKVYQSSFIPGLHDTVSIFEKPPASKGE